VTSGASSGRRYMNLRSEGGGAHRTMESPLQYCEASQFFELETSCPLIIVAIQ